MIGVSGNVRMDSDLPHPMSPMLFNVELVVQFSFAMTNVLEF